jgi:hypothetical protein
MSLSPSEQSNDGRHFCMPTGCTLGYRTQTVGLQANPLSATKGYLRPQTEDFAGVQIYATLQCQELPWESG